MRRRVFLILPATLVFSWLAMAGFGSSLAAGAEKHPFGLKDYSALRAARALAISPDGKTVLFVVSFDGEKGPTKHEWRLIDVSGENNRKLDLPESFEPQGFLKDGVTLYGSYEVAKKAQLGIVPIASAKPTQIISLPDGMHGAALSPDGSRFAVISDPRAQASKKSYLTKPRKSPAPVAPARKTLSSSLFSAPPTAPPMAARQSQAPSPVAAAAAAAVAAATNPDRSRIPGPCTTRSLQRPTACIVPPLNSAPLAASFAPCHPELAA